MCANAMQEQRMRDYAKRHGIKITEDSTWDDLSAHVFPHKPVYAIRQGDSGLLLEQMEFSLVSKAEQTSRGSKPYATFNARLDSLVEKWTWKKPLTETRAIIPLDWFIEPAYWGPLAGNMVRYVPKRVLLAAAIWKEWKSPKINSVHSTAMIVHEPYPLVEKNGHDRSPLFLESDAAEEWIRAEKEDGVTLVKFLEENRTTPELTAEVERPLAKGWGKRVPEKYRVRAASG